MQKKETVGKLVANCNRLGNTAKKSESCSNIAEYAKLRHAIPTTRICSAILTRQRGGQSLPSQLTGTYIDDEDS